jgi:hypothetical protein
MKSLETHQINNILIYTTTLSLSLSQDFYVSVKISGQHTVAVVSIQDNISSSEICVVVNTLGLVDQSLSSSYWKVQGHSEHLCQRNIILTFLAQLSSSESSSEFF